MLNPVLNILSTIVIFQLLLLAVFLFTVNKGKPASNKLLAIFFLWLAFNLGDGLLSYYGFYNKFPQLAHLEDGFVFLVGPILYFYTRSIIYRRFKLAPKNIIHLVPFAVFTILFQLFYHLQPEEFQKVIQSAIQQQQLPAGFYFSIVVVYAHIVAYLYYAYRDIVYYRGQLREKFSHLGRRNLDWLMFMIVSVGILLLLSFVYSFLPLATRTLFNSGLIVLMGFIFGFINTIVWKALKQPGIFSGVDDELKKEKYAGSTLSEAERRDGCLRLDNLMTLEKPYLRADFTLEQLAAKTSMTPKKLSQLINENYHQNFFDFINSFRILEAQRLLKESTDAKLTVLEVMYQTGFNSKSSFNTLFKKKTGQTPTEFKKTL